MRFLDITSISCSQCLENQITYNTTESTCYFCNPGYEVIDNNNPQFTDHCFTGDYPTDLKDYKDEKIQEQLSLLSDDDINI